MVRRVYVETSVWSMALDGQPPVLRTPTLQLLAQFERGIMEACISDVVLIEIGRAEPARRATLQEQVARMSPFVLPLSHEVEALSQRFIDEGILTLDRRDDARHVACAMVHDIALLVSWNYRHIANTRKAERFNAVAVLEGYSGHTEIHTPLEVLE